VCLALLGISRLASAHPDPLENIKIYTYILASSPENALVYLNRGICYRLVFDFEKSIADIDHAEKLGIKGRSLWMNRAMACLPLKQFDRAYEDMSRILDVSPDDPSSYFYRGEVLFRQGRYREAIGDYTKSLSLKRSHYVYFVRADASRLIGDVSQALSDYSQALQIAEYMIPYWMARAKMLGAQGRFEEARGDLDQAVRKQPERYQVYMDRAVLSASQGLEASRTADLKLAFKYIEDEIFFRPRDPMVYADRAQVFEQMGDLLRAREDFDKAVDLSNPNDPKYWRLRAGFLRRLGEEERATADLTQACEAEDRPLPTATPLPGPTLTLEELSMQPTPNLLPEIQR
jgi:tetratricopeptide (TPR) repeat protein